MGITPTPEEKAAVETHKQEVQASMDRLDNAVHDLSKEVKFIKQDRKQNRDTIASMLDETLQALRRDKNR